MVSGKNRVKIKATNIPVNINGVTIQPNDWVLGDDNGVVVIYDAHLEAIIGRAENVHNTEAEIVRAIESGVSLTTARENFGYATPWAKK